MLIIELLISEAYEHVPPHTFCLEARALVDDSDGSEALKAAIKAKIKQAAAGTSTHTTGWRSSGQAKQAAKILIEVATKCVKGANGRCTPTEALPELEAAAKLAQQAAAAGGGWWG